MDIRLIVPERWFQFGRWHTADAGDEAGISVVKLPIQLPRAGPASWYLHIYPTLARQIRQFGPDVIHLWEEPWSFVALQANRLARRENAAFVLEVDQNIYKRLPPPFGTIRRHVLQRTNLLLCRSQMAADVARACGYRGPICFIGYGVDEAVFYPAAERHRDNTLRLGFVGRLVEEKGIDDLLAAVSTTAGDVRLTIVGEGPHEGVIRARIHELGLTDRVSLLPWATPDKLGAFLRSIDILVLPTRTTASVREQFGRVIIEAQACGTPVIGSTSGAIPDVVGQGGWIVPESDPAALSRLLERLIGNGGEVEARARAGLANVATRFTHSIVSSALASAWRQADALRTTRQQRTRGSEKTRPISRVGT